MIKISSINLDKTQVREVIKTLESNYLVQGKKVEQLEAILANYVGVKHAIAVNNGTAALHTALHAVGVKAGDEVITTPLSFVATANAIMMCGATPVFGDIDEKTYNLDPYSVEQLITKKTAAVLAVDLYGNPAEYHTLKKICAKHKLVLITDSCQAIGAQYHGQKVGSLADISVFSFYASKNIFSGEGGAITTNNQAFAQAARLFRNHGQMSGKQYEYFGLGYNYRLTDVLASVLLPQLDDIDEITTKRTKHAQYLSQKLSSMPGIIPPSISPHTTHCFHQYTIRVTSDFPLTRDDLHSLLQAKQIESRVYYPQLLTDIAHVKRATKTKTIKQTLAARRVLPQILSLPVHQHLTKQDLDTIVTAIETAAAHV